MRVKTRATPKPISNDCRKIISCVCLNAGSWIQTSRSKIFLIIDRSSYFLTHGYSSSFPRLDWSSRYIADSSNSHNSQGRRCRWWRPCNTMHIPRHAAYNVDIPRTQNTAEKARHPRDVLLRVVRIAYKKPKTIKLIPRALANIWRGLLPLQMLQRMKLGWAWCLKLCSTVSATGWRALGWVVVERRSRRQIRWREERFSSWEPLSAIYMAMIRSISSRCGKLLSEDRSVSLRK